MYTSMGGREIPADPPEMPHGARLRALGRTYFLFCNKLTNVHVERPRPDFPESYF